MALPLWGFCPVVRQPRTLPPRPCPQGLPPRCLLGAPSVQAAPPRVPPNTCMPRVPAGARCGQAGIREQDMVTQHGPGGLQLAPVRSVGAGREGRVFGGAETRQMRDRPPALAAAWSPWSSVPKACLSPTGDLSVPACSLVDLQQLSQRGCRRRLARALRSGRQERVCLPVARGPEEGQEGSGPPPASQGSGGRQGRQGRERPGALPATPVLRCPRRHLGPARSPPGTA